MTKTIQRLPAVKHESGLSRSTIYLRIAQGLWTKPISLGGRAVGWPSNEVAAINAARIAGKSDAEIRALVLQLEQDRKVFFCMNTGHKHFIESTQIFPKLSRLFQWHCRVKTFAACGVQAIFLRPMLYGIKESLCVLVLYALGAGYATRKGSAA